MTPEERSSASNGIWMCRDHGKAIDSSDPEFTVERLREWKRLAENASWRRVLHNEDLPGQAVAGDLQLLSRIRTAAEADLKVFQQTAKWPTTSVALTLNVDGLGEPMTTVALAGVVMSLDDLILVAPPGMGKTTTLFQVAGGILANGNGVPLVVPLGDWATEGVAVLESILRRPAFRGISEDDFRKAAATPGVVLLLDGWNELNADARNRARVHVSTLKAELPQLGLIVSTRRQMFDVPFEGTRVEISQLNEEQQIQIALGMRGDAGSKIVDQAWRTAGVRELVTIPLYLTALLSLPEHVPFPVTKEEVLRHFVDAHEMEASRAEALYAVVHGFQQEYLKGLADFAMRSSNTSIADVDARRSISETATFLAKDGQVTRKPEPSAVLDVLVSNHVLMRAGYTHGVSFQHQQFQEWYASRSVERRIIAEVDDPGACKALKAEIFNLPVWEEAILFAVERLARGDAHQCAACGKAIIVAFECDPILAAEMIFRSTEEVWAQIATTIKGFVARWHAPGKVDRALRFMLTSGRPEFLDQVWPLITDQNEQVSLKALRNCGRFRPSILGKDAEKKIKALPKQSRMVLLSEIAHNSGIDGLDLVSRITKDDPDPEVQASVVDALTFRHADRHATLVLQNASDQTFDLVALRGLVDEVGDEQVKKGVAAARERHVPKETSAINPLRVILYAKDCKDRSAELTDIISTMNIEKGENTSIQLIYELYNRYPSAVSAGILARVRADSTLFYGADDILASAGFSFEDDALLQIALAETIRPDVRAEAAASVLGPQATGHMIDALSDADTRIRDVNGKYDKAASDRYHDIQARIAHVPGSSLIAAVQARSTVADNENMERMADLLIRHSNSDSDSARCFNQEDLSAIRTLAEDWGNRMLASGNAERRQVARIAVLASHAPAVGLLPLLKRMLDNNLQRYHAFREEAEAAGWRDGNAVHEAQWPLMHEYQRAFLAIDAPESDALMREYLVDPYFGELAATVLVSRWITKNEPPPDKRFFGGLDFSRVGEKRAVLAADPSATSAEAEAIFAAIVPLIADGATEDQKKHGVALGIIAVRLPHGQRHATIEKLIDLSARRGKSRLLMNLILSGADVDSKLVAEGIAETLEVAKKNTWMLKENQDYELREWLKLLPFTNLTSNTLELIHSIPGALRLRLILDEVVGGLAETPSEGGEEVLFKLAEEEPYFYETRQWRTAALKIGTATAAHRLIDLTANGKFGSKSNDAWHWKKELSILITKFPHVRRHVYGLLKDGLTSRHLQLLAEAVSESPDTEGALLLIEIENKQKRLVLGRRAIEKIITEHIPIENYSGVYDVVSVPANELRQKLLDMTTDGGPADAASRCLITIDAIRDELGKPLSELRHPHLASGRPWPILSPDPDATAD